MIQVDEREQIRIAYYLEHQSVRQIAREQHHARATVRQALDAAEPARYELSVPRAAPVLGAYKARIDELLAENEQLPRKQRRTGKQVYLQLQAEGYAGSDSTVYTYLWLKRKHTQRLPLYLPLEFDPGAYAQADWGEAEVVIAAQRWDAQLFVMRLCYSRRLFVAVYPTQRQEAFLDGHQQAFLFFGGVPHVITYDNLTTAVQQILTGQLRAEQRQFVAFRSHYLFDSRFCNPGEAHEKGGVESAVGYARRNFLSPPPSANSWAELNTQLWQRCLAEDARVVAGQSQSIGQRFAQEQSVLRRLPERSYACCVTREVTLNGYSQVSFETNHYSVPVEAARKQLTLRAFAFRIQILDGERVLAEHPRSHGRAQEVADWKHYLPLLEERPGAFEHAKPLREWRKRWPPIYQQLLDQLTRERGLESRASVKEFVRVLRLLREHPVEQVEEAIALALAHGCAHADGVLLCLHQLQHPSAPPLVLSLESQPQLQAIGSQSLDLRAYDRLLPAASRAPQSLAGDGRAA